MRIDELVKVFKKIGIKRYSMDGRGNGVIKSEVEMNGKKHKICVYWSEVVVTDVSEDVVLFTDKRNLEKQLRRMLLLGEF